MLIVAAGAMFIGANLGVAILEPLAIENFSTPDLNYEEPREFERELACLNGGGSWVVNRHEDPITGQTRFRDALRLRLGYVCQMPGQQELEGP